MLMTIKQIELENMLFEYIKQIDQIDRALKATRLDMKDVSRRIQLRLLEEKKGKLSPLKINLWQKLS